MSTSSGQLIPGQQTEKLRLFRALLFSLGCQVAILDLGHKMRHEISATQGRPADQRLSYPMAKPAAGTLL